jgi:protein SCO1/2
MKNKFFAIIILFIAISFISCYEEFPLNKDLTKKSYTFLNQDSTSVEFPEVIKGNTTVMGFIYTHCPDICPMTTHNMYLTEQRLHKEGINDVKFVSLSFDPDRDAPSVLTKFAEVRDISFKNWMLLTGELLVTKDLLRRFDVRAIPTDSVFYKDGTASYSMMHTDRISLIDKNGILKKNYKGSTINIDELIADIKYLGDY